MQTRPLDLPEHELLPLLREAISQNVFSEEFLQELNSALNARMLDLPDDFAEDALLDTANLDEADTGIPGTVFVSTALGSHGPRIKWYPGAPGRTLPCMIVSIDPEPQVRADFVGPRLSRPVTPLLTEWVKLNCAQLLEFWNHGETWNRRQVSDFLDGLRRLPR